MTFVSLSGWQGWLLLPGMLVMDWLARTYPLFVIRTGIGFSTESYLFWSALVSALFWVVLLSLLVSAWRYLRRRARRN